MSHSSTVDLTVRKALLFALVAEQLSVFYEQGIWITESQGTSLAGRWLTEAKLVLPEGETRQFSALADQLARQMADSLSREAGLYAVHEMMEARGPRYESPFAQDIQAECERQLVESKLV
ncbi:hypothetical protein [Chitinimonas sp. BJB300]|uniref:hypothetical protein n=1 Tax=Chitinimonas sp. BJB300 TaxID=1559339 RepID=UPI000C0EAA31|nr:hypothetical protein [Chitinimonas sp. BJB300]PHV11361.1 hypothetical protein CSQ89_11360 [Chitinimonas sp. BJB300]TSJ87465.1 hypothetical protein FG002_013065 [Chitinimonas sp. BJB300]